MPDRTIDQILADVHKGIRALDVAVDALQKIGMMGGVTGDWAKDAIAEVGRTLEGEPPQLRALPDLLETGLGR